MVWRITQRIKGSLQTNKIIKDKALTRNIILFMHAQALNEYSDTVKAIWIIIVILKGAYCFLLKCNIKF